MTLFKPRVGKVIFALTIGGLCVIIPNFLCIPSYLHTIVGVLVFGLCCKHFPFFYRPLFNISLHPLLLALLL